MTKIWTQSYEPVELTDARIQNDMEEHLDVYMHVIACQSLLGRFPKTTLEITSKFQPADYFNVGGMFVVSDRLKAIFEEFHTSVEFFPLQIEYKGSLLQDPKFYFCNLLDSVQGFDLDKGKYVFWKKPGFTDRIQTIKKLVIDEEAVAPFPLFRLAKCSPVIICTSDALASRITSSNLTGMKFIEPSKWRFGM